MSPLVLILGVAAGLPLAAVAVLALARRGDRKLKPRLQRIAEPLTKRAMEGNSEIDSGIFRTVQVRSRSGRVMRFVQARYPLVDARRALPRAIAFGIVAAAASWLAMWFLKVPPGWWTPPLVCLAAAVAVIYAMSWFQLRQETEFTRQFPETLDQIVRLSRAGVPALEAISVITDDCRPPIEPVLRKVCESLIAGLDADTALHGVAAHVRLTEFTLFAAVIHLQRRSGGSISAAFANLSRACASAAPSR